MPGEVTIDDNLMKLLSRGRLLDVQRRDALERIYFVSAGSAINLFALDVEFHVFRFSEKLWVLPSKTAGVEAAIPAIWPEQRRRSDRCWETVIAEMPRAWRKSFLWGLARPHTPSLLVLPLSALPRWRIKRKHSNANYVGEHDFPYLNYLIGCWFHQDWDIEGDTLDAVIASFKKSEAPADWTETRADIERLLNRYDDQNLAREFIRLFRPDVDPEGWGMSTRQWLARIGELLQ